MRTLFSDYVRSVRIDKNIGLMQAATELGVEPSYLRDIERGSREVSDDVIEKMAGVYGEERDLLFYLAGRFAPELRNHDPKIMAYRLFLLREDIETVRGLMRDPLEVRRELQRG